MKSRNLWIVGIVLVTLALISLFVAPVNNDLRRGSTYSRTPDGYGAWYASLQKQGIAVQRWQRPVWELIEPPDNAPTSRPTPRAPLTLVRVNPFFGGLVSGEDTEWMARGNVVVVLGVQGPVTRAPFRSRLAGVKVETSRRASLSQRADKQPKQRLGDSFGAVVWEEPVGKGKLIFATTPHLAANAYQDEPGNFKLLTQLVTEPGHPIWIDEYIHGYRDPDPTVAAEERNWITYLSQTPLLVLAVQAGVLLLVLIWGQNRRLGPPVPLPSPKVDNSAAYMQALGSVLDKAECSEFILETVGKAELLHAQRALGLGTIPVEATALTQAWAQQTGRSPEELAAVLRPVEQKRRLNQRELLNWLEQLQTIRRHLPHE